MNPWAPKISSIINDIVDKPSILNYPVGSLQYPFFDTALPDAYLFGTIGTQVAQHMSEIINQHIERSFADGRRHEFDNHHLQCYTHQYFGDYIGENRTLLIHGSYEDAQKIWPLAWSHKIQDSVGLNMAFNAYKRRASTRGDQKRRLPKLLKYSSEQLFFIAYANMYCESPTTLQSTSRAPWFKDRGYSNSDMVNMAIMNNQYFGKVFNCSLGTPMNPIKKCSYWEDMPYLHI